MRPPAPVLFTIILAVISTILVKYSGDLIFYYYGARPYMMDDISASIQNMAYWGG